VESVAWIYAQHTHRCILVDPINYAARMYDTAGDGTAPASTEYGTRLFISPERRCITPLRQLKKQYPSSIQSLFAKLVQLPS